MSRPVFDQDTIVRFVFGDKANHTTHNLNWRAVQPMRNEESSNFEVSVFITTLLSPEQIDDIGFNIVGKERNLDPDYKIIFSHNVIHPLGLKVVLEESRHQYHGNIVNWSEMDDVRLEQAKELAILLKKNNTVLIEKIYRK